MSEARKAYFRGSCIAIQFADGNVNEFDASLGEDANWSLVCFDGRQQGWKEMELNEALEIADSCGLTYQ